MSHLTFVLASYGVTAFGLAAIFIWLLADGCRQRTALKQLQNHLKRQEQQP